MAEISDCLKEVKNILSILCEHFKETSILRWLAWVKPSTLDFLWGHRRNTHRTFTYTFEAYILQHLWCLILFNLPVLIIVIPRTEKQREDHQRLLIAGTSCHLLKETSKTTSQSSHEILCCIVFMSKPNLLQCQALFYSDVSLKNCLRHIFI